MDTTPVAVGGADDAPEHGFHGPDALRVCVLGSLRVERSGAVVRVGGSRRRRLFLRLAIDANRVVTPDLLAYDLWEGNPPRAASSTLQSHISLLRQELGQGRIYFAEGGYRLVLGDGELDSALFETLVAEAGRDLRAGAHSEALGLIDRALGLWRGAPYADAAEAVWAAGTVTRLREAHASAVEDALTARLELGQVREAVVLAEAACTEQPLREHRWALLMKALYRDSRQGEALQAFARARRVLREELGIEPSEELADLERAILLQEPELTRPVRPASPSSGGRLPAPPGLFVGRSRERRHLEKLVEQHRLATIVGPGGAGKTRLAVECARELARRYRDGVSFVNLADAGDDHDVTRAVATCTGVTLRAGGGGVGALVEQLVAHEALLLVDNCEQVLEPVAVLVEQLLETCTGLRVLATSRAPLRVPGEVVWTIPPMATPADPEDPGLGAEELASYDGVSLFLERASEAGIEGPMNLDRLRTVARIGGALDGLPLAIELAAARTPALGLDAVADRLGSVLELLSVGARTARARQRTLRATIQWSYDLLREDLRGALRAASIFPAGFTAEALGQVLRDERASCGSTAESAALLAENSLLAIAPGSGVMNRYRMLTVVREFATERLRDEDGAGRLAALQGAHAAYYSRMALASLPRLTGPRQGTVLSDLENEYANLTMAIDSLVRSGSGADALGVIVALERFWHNRAHLGDCAELLARAWPVGADAAESSVRVKALTLSGQARMEMALGDARLDFVKARDLAAEAGDEGGLSAGLGGLAAVHYYSRAYAEAHELGLESVEMARRTGDPIRLGESLVTLGVVLVDDLDAARRAYSEAIMVTTTTGDRVFEALAHNNLGSCLLTYGEIGEAAVHLRQAIASYEQVGLPYAMPLVNLGWVQLQQGSLPGAAAIFAESIRHSHRWHLPRQEALGALGLGCTAVAQENWRNGAALIALADLRLERCGHVWEEPEETYRAVAMSAIEERLGEQARLAYLSGRTRELDELIDNVTSPPIVLT